MYVYVCISVIFNAECAVRTNRPTVIDSNRQIRIKLHSLENCIIIVLYSVIHLVIRVESMEARTVREKKPLVVRSLPMILKFQLTNETLMPNTYDRNEDRYKLMSKSYLNMLLSTKQFIRLTRETKRIERIQL